MRIDFDFGWYQQISAKTKTYILTTAELLCLFAMRYPAWIKKMAYYISFSSLLITSTIANSLGEPAPKRNECYQNGTYPLAILIAISSQESPENCANYCKSLVDCKYFTFDPIKKLCEALNLDKYDRYPYPDGIYTKHCPDCVSGLRDRFCGAHGFCKVCTIL